MNPTLINALLVGVGLAVQALWTVANLKQSKKNLEQVDKVKDWVRDNYYDKPYITKRDEEISARLTRAGA